MAFDSELHGLAVMRGKAWARFNRACDKPNGAEAEACILEVRYWQRKEKERKAELA